MILPRGGRGTAREASGGGVSRREMPPEVLRARKLPRAMSYPEVLLWQRLRGSPCGVGFRRQHPIGSDYTADFYCPAAKLVVEIDGEVHAIEGAPERDASRDAYMRGRGLDAYMRGRGLTVIRVPARDVLANADGAAASIVTLASAGSRRDRPSTMPQERRGLPPRSGEEQEAAAHADYQLRRSAQAFGPRSAKADRGGDLDQHDCERGHGDIHGLGRR